MVEILLRFAIGGVVVSLFAIVGDIFRPKSFAGLDDAIARLSTFDWLLFTSANAVEIFRQRLHGDLPPGLSLAVIGSITARAAQKAGFEVALQPEKATGDGLAAARLPA